MTGAVQIARVFGIRVRLHFSWMFIFFLVAWSLARSYLPDAYPGWAPGTYWAVGVAGSVFLFLSVLLHEFSHSLVAIARGHKVKAITLFLLGGVSEIETAAARPADEFWIAIVGPLMSLLIAGISWGVFVLVGPEGNQQTRGLASYLSVINLSLGVFNMVPGFPMDGGRVLRSIVWRATGSQRRATIVATSVGQLIGLAFIGGGIVVAFSTTNFVTGLWLIFVGWFIQSSAAASKHEEAMHGALSGRRVREVMRTPFPSVTPGTSVEQLVDEHIARGFERAFVVMLGNTHYGLVTVSDVRRVPRGDWRATPVTRIMTRAPDVVSVSPEDPLEEAFRKLAGKRVHQLAVIEGGAVIGIVTRGDVLNVFDLADLVTSGDSPGAGEPRRTMQP